MVQHNSTKEESVLKLMRWPANICYLGFNQDSNSWGGRFRRVIIDDHPLNKVFEDEELDDEVKEETVGQGLDVDGGKISEKAAVRHDDHHVPVRGPPVLANILLISLLQVSQRGLLH